jgi:5-methylcytosine-specific restriction protein A
MVTSVEKVTTSVDPIPPRLAGTIPHFVVGREYNRRDDIHLNYGGSRQSGISSSGACPAIFLFTGDTGEQYGYRDDFDSDNVFSYTGEGQVGDMEFKTGSRAIRDHAADGRSLYLFRSHGKGKSQKYLGEFVLANYSIRRAPDRNGQERNVIVFHLPRVDATQDAPTIVSQPTSPVSMGEARKKAIAACSGVTGAAGTQAVRTVYERSKAVRDYVLLRANGSCEACSKPAPFLGTDLQPYLEAHHTTRMSDGGVDHPRHVAALCPTCDREIHYGKHGPTLNTRLVELLTHLEPAP